MRLTRRTGRVEMVAAAMSAAVLALVSLAAIGPAGTASAATARTARTGTAANVAFPSDRQPLTFHHSCAWPPPPGHVACLALVPDAKMPSSITAINTTDLGGGCAQVQLAQDTEACYGPADLENAYNLTSASASAGSKATVALVDAYDDPNAASDLAVYRSYYGLPACTTANGCFKKVNEQGKTSGYPAPNADWSAEISLDLDMVSAICPNCHILLVEASSDSEADLGPAVNEAVTLGAKYVSNSYGQNEFSGEQSYDSYYNHPGVVVTAGAGDAGYGLLYPAASRFVTAVGGTSLLPASNARGWDEIAWSGTGSGCSAYEPKPLWQDDTGCALRTDNDVAAVADPETGVAIYDTYDLWEPTGGACDEGWCEEGGTSASSPIIASVYALAGTPASGTYPAQYPYDDEEGLNDIVAGTDTFSGCTPAYLCTAGPGYDAPTGWGTPDGVAAFSSSS
jgi:subtilase family serine protease